MEEEKIEDVKLVIDKEAEGEVPKIEKVTPKKAPAKKKDRLPEELHEVPVHRMNTTELKSYVQFIREQNGYLGDKIVQLEKVAESSFKASREANEALNTIKNKANRRLTFLTTQITMLNESVNLLKGEV